MQRKSSVHFKPVTNIKFAASHSERTDLSEPAYLLPKEHQLDNVIVDGSLSENELAALFIKQKEAMTGQAKARGSSPFWEGVVVLGNTDAQEQSANLLDWKKAYEQTTGHKVLHMSIHLDEGYIDKAGNPQYNPHAHVIVSRMNEKNRIIKLERKELAAIQDLTAETLKMERGSTLAERGGKRGREHIPHAEFRLFANQKRLEVGKEKGNADLYGSLLDEANRQSKIVRQKLKETTQALLDKDAEISKLKAEYTEAREALKASGEASQADYQALKKTHEAALADLVEKLKVQYTINGNLLLNEAESHKRHMAEIAQLKAQYQQDREAMKASGEATQQDYQQLKKAHEAALAEAGKVPDLAKQLRESQQQAATAQQGLIDAKGKTATQSAEVATLKADLAEARQQAATATKVQELERQLKAAQEQATTAQQGRDEAQSKAQQQAQEITQLKAQYQQDREAMKASGEATQQDYQQLKKAHEAALAEAAKAPDLERQLRSAQERAATAQQEAINTKLTGDKRYKELRGQALEIQAERNEFAEEIATLKARAAAPQPVQQAPTPPAAQAVQVVTTSPTPEKSSREVFLALYAHLKTVLVGLIDGMRLDAADGRLGLFSSHSRSGPRVQVLCEVPLNQAMPEIGQCFNSRAIPGRGRGGIGD